MVNHKVYIFIIIGLFSTSITYANKYKCTADLAAGFKNIDNNWTPSTFKVKGIKYIIKARNNDSKIYEVTEIDNNSGYYICSKGFIKGFLNCRSFGREFRFNDNNGRYIIFKKYGYIDGSTDTPNIEIGNCTSEI